MKLDDIEFDDPFDWVDEFTWSAVEQEQQRGLSGALLVQEGLKRFGRPITLASNGGVWTPLKTVRAVEALRDVPGKVMALTLADGRAFSVVFDRTGGAPLEAIPVERQAVPGPEEPYEITLRLLTVAPPP